MHKLLVCSHVSPLSAPAQPSPAPRSGQFSQHSVPDGDRSRTSLLPAGTEEEAPTSPSPTSDLPLPALATLLISTFSPLHHPVCGWSWGWSSISTPAHAVIIIPWLSQTSAQGGTPSSPISKASSPFLSLELGSYLSPLIPGQPHTPQGGTAPWLQPHMPSRPSVPPALLLIFSSTCRFPLCLLVLPVSFSRQELQVSHHGTLIPLRDSSCSHRITDALLKAPKSFSSGRKLMFTLKKPFAEGQRHNLCSSQKLLQ